MRAGADVAATSASAGVSPARTSSSSSRCRLAPCAVPGFGASVPARIGTPAARSCRTASKAYARSSFLSGLNGNAAFRLPRSAAVRYGVMRGFFASDAPLGAPVMLSFTVSVAMTKA